MRENGQKRGKMDKNEDNEQDGKCTKRKMNKK